MAKNINIKIVLVNNGPIFTLEQTLEEVDDTSIFSSIQKAQHAHAEVTKALADDYKEAMRLTRALRSTDVTPLSSEDQAKVVQLDAEAADEKEAQKAAKAAAKKAAVKVHTAEELEDMTVEVLKGHAKEASISGYSKMNKSQLVSSLS